MPVSTQLVECFYYSKVSTILVRGKNKRRRIAAARSAAVPAWTHRVEHLIRVTLPDGQVGRLHHIPLINLS